MPSKDVRDLKRNLDAVLTKNVLSVYNGQSLAEECADALSKIVDSSYYLKGGNALNLLQAQPVTGDWDFQFKPGQSTYTQWNTAYAAIDSAIAGILNTLAGRFASSSGIETAFKNLKDPAIRPLNGDISQYNQTQSFTIGKSGYLLKSYSAILNDSKYSRNHITGDGRLQLDPGDIVMLPNAPITKTGVVIPCVYINYSIPGFILYRLAIRYSYELANPSDYFDDPSTKTVTLKSELIDISVPRPGSAEIHMAQDGVITNFFDTGVSGKKIRIPGWGYHLYENINLLQEIKLGISGSAHKKQKRIDRGALAFQTIKTDNNGKDLIKGPGPLKDSPAGNSLAFIEIYLQMLKCPIVAESLANLSDSAALKLDLYGLLAGRTETAKLSDFPALVNFDFNWLGRPLTGEVISFLKNFLKISYTPTTPGLGVTGVNIIEKQAKELEMLRQNEEFTVVSPLLDLDPKTIFPFPFVLVHVNNESRFNSLTAGNNFVPLNDFSPAIKIWRSIAKTPTQYASLTPMYIRLIFAHTPALENDYLISNYLENSLLISQRQALADAYQGN